MKKYLICFAILLWVFTATSQNGSDPQAILHRAMGVVGSIHLENRMLTIESMDGLQTHLFVWHDWTQFIQDDKEVAPELLKAGTVVEYWYRHSSYGDPFVLRVAWKSDSPVIASIGE